MLFICYPITNVEILKGHKYRLEIPKQTAKTDAAGALPPQEKTWPWCMRGKNVGDHLILSQK